MPVLLITVQIPFLLLLKPHSPSGVFLCSGKRKNYKNKYKYLSNYERITPTGLAGDYVVKCPRLPELEEIITQKPDCLFMSCDADTEKFSSDTKHIYVNVCPKNSTIRVFVPGRKYPDWYAVSVKNIG